MGAKISFELKQDTPMIHFQGGTEDAVLRASEVKPKLDRFLTEWCERIGMEIREGWKADRDYNAYDYKMRIYASEINNGISAYNRAVKRGGCDKLSSYFGDLKGQRKNLWYEVGIKIEILCFHESLRNVISEAIETFFVLHNFGTRQNRGIGGFTLNSTTAEKAERLLTDWYANRRITIYKMVFETGTTVSGMLKCGNMYYQILKSGINSNGIYIKSYLTEYFLNRSVGDSLKPQLIGGEKRWMKEQGISPAIGRSSGKDNNIREVHDYRYIRGLLGVSNEVRYQDGAGGTETIKITSDEFDRVPSPIRYKVIGNVLFIIPLVPGSDIYGRGKQICGKKFEFHNKKNNKQGCLFTPYQNKEFTMSGLIHGYIRYLNGDINEKVKNYAKKKHIPLPIPAGRPAAWIQRCKGGEQE